MKNMLPEYYESGKVFQDWKCIKQSTPFTRPANRIDPHFVFVSKYKVEGDYRLRVVSDTDSREALFSLTPPKNDDTVWTEGIRV